MVHNGKYNFTDPKSGMPYSINCEGPTS